MRDVTQSELAGRLHIDPSLVSKWENGIRPPIPELLDALCRELGLNHSDSRELRLAAAIVPQPEKNVKWALGFRPIYRRSLMWFVCGQLVGVSFVSFLVVRLYVAQRIAVPAHDLFGADQLVPYASFFFLAGVLLLLASPSIGFLMHQVYFALYWLPIQVRSGSSPSDRAYPILVEFEKEQGLNIHQLLGQRPLITDHSQTRRATSFSPFIRVRSSAELEAARKNWRLLRTIWMNAISRANMEYADALIGFKEDMFTMLGAGMVSLATGFTLYVAYEILVHGSKVISGDLSYVWGIVMGGLLVSLVLGVLRRVRKDTGVDALETRRLFLRIACDKIYSAGGPSTRSYP